MGPHVPATHTLERNAADRHAWRHTPAWNTHAGHPQSQTPPSPGSTGVCACTQSTGRAQGAPEGVAPNCCPEIALPGSCVPRAPGTLCSPQELQGQWAGHCMHRAPGTPCSPRGLQGQWAGRCMRSAPGTLCSPRGLQGRWAGAACAGHQGPCVHLGGFRGGGQGAACAGHQGPCVHLGGFRGSGQAGGRLLHVTSGGLLFKCHQAPPCSEPAMAPVTGAKPVSCSGSRPGVIGPVVLSSNLQTQPPPPWLSDRPQGLCVCCFHCLFPLFSLMRICMIRSHSSFHRRAWMRLPFLPPAPPT